MAAIVRVGETEDMLEIQTDAGHVILLDVAALLAKPRFAPLSDDDRILYPHTDGESIYWRYGPRLGLHEVVSILGEPPPREKPHWRPQR
ncbi:hypothetical protein LJC34_05965 [Oscillospiraceae bacterium OttesenSCG-928-G22]|nr:hypothetical protein [Oscillospiraceae bacterium OttesenSCG-928-G22]